jgi:hypothetical protein
MRKVAFYGLPGFPIHPEAQPDVRTSILWDIDGDQDLGFSWATIQDHLYVQAVPTTELRGWVSNKHSQSEPAVLPRFGDVTGDQVAEMVALDNHLGSTYGFTSFLWRQESPSVLANRYRTGPRLTWNLGR